MQLCIALDLPSREANLTLLRTIASHNIWVKVGLRSFLRDGQELIEAIHAINPRFDIFLDLKLYDIPNTMADAAEEIVHMGIKMFNIHASAGEAAMQTVMERVHSCTPTPPLVTAVTALTSFDTNGFEAIYHTPMDTAIVDFAKAAHRQQLDGVVCSVHESQMIKQATAPDFLTITPGVRPFGESSGDQQRVANLDDARSAACDLIVVGRPIYQADDPAAVVERILSEL